MSNDYSRNAGTQSQMISNGAKQKAGSAKVLHNIMGGAGSYTALGARIFFTHAGSKRVGWIIDCGSDFPATMREQIEQWDTSCLFRETPDRLTTRGWNGYGNGVSEQRAFRYLTPKLRLDEASLTPELLLSKSFHMICSPQRCLSMVQGVLRRRNELLAGMMEMGGQLREHWHDKPLFVWEPVPDVCTAEEWENCKAALKMVDCVSPNHVELAAFFGLEAEVEDSSGNVNKRKVEELAGRLAEAGIGSGSEGSVVVRVGKEGCCIVRPSLNRPVWQPAYHVIGTGKVVDPTGGGNTFLGGLAAALANNCSVDIAAAVGSVVAGIAIEQIGMPKLDISLDAWNGLSFSERCKIYEQRAKESGSLLQLDKLALRSV